MKNNFVITGIVVVVVAAVAFFAGTKYQQNQTSQTSQTTQGAGRGQGRNRNGGGGGRVMGDILNADDKSITVKMPDGSTKLVLLSSTTAITTATAAAKTDLKVGTRVGVFGTDNPDGSTTAQTIQLNPMFRVGTGS